MVDLDLEKFFDRVDQDLLMGLVAVGPGLPAGRDATPPASRGPTVSDRPLLRLIRGFLSAGVLADGLVARGDQAGTRTTIRMGHRQRRNAGRA